MDSNLKVLLCVDYPAYVKNESEAIRTLGGMERLKQTFSRRNTKLILNYTPDNIFSKMLCSSQINEEETNSCGTSSHHSLLNRQQSSIDEDELNNNKSATSSSSTPTKNEAKNGGHSISNTSKQSDFISMPCLLMSVKKNESKKFEARIIGKIKKVYTFQKIADFQYLPMSCSSVKRQANPSTTTSSTTTQFTYTSFYENFLFNNIHDYDHELRRNNLPQLFILPPFFSRFDDPVSYAFRSESVKTKSPGEKTLGKTIAAITAAPTTASTSSPTKQQKSPRHQSNELVDDGEDNDDDESRMMMQRRSRNENESLVASSESVNNLNESTSSNNNNNNNSNELIMSMRQERSSQALLITFNCKEVPMKPSEKLKSIRNESQIECIESLKKLFNERPCFLKSVLLCITSYSASLLKESLPYVAYYFTTGPWRSCWVRFGFDPRQNPEAKKYQMIDYRLRNNAEPDQMVKAKPRSSYHKRKFRSDLADPELDEYKNFKVEKEMYKFNPDKLPASRNVFYQICDIQDDDVQNLIKSDDNLIPKCTEKDGWCSANIQDKCRNIMSQKHEKLVKLLSNETKEEKKLKNNK